MTLDSVCNVCSGAPSFAKICSGGILFVKDTHAYFCVLSDTLNLYILKVSIDPPEYLLQQVKSQIYKNRGSPGNGMVTFILFCFTCFLNALHDFELHEPL